jgi:hypothetical protein
MRFLVILFTLAFTLKVVADDNLQPQDNSKDVIPVVISGSTSAAALATSVLTARQAAHNEAIIAENRINIPAAERRLPELVSRVQELEAIKPEQIARQEFRVTQALPADLGHAASQATYFQEYIDDPELSARANAVLERMKEHVGHPNTSRESLDRIRELQNSNLEQQYEAIVQEARDKGLIQTRQATNVRAQFEYMGNEVKTIAARLDREDLNHRGFVNESGYASNKSNVFVLRLKKAFSLETIEHLRQQALITARTRLQLQNTSIAEKKAASEKATKSAPRLRKASLISRYVGGTGVVATLGLGWFISSGTSVDTQLLSETNPSTVSVEEIDRTQEASN